MRAVVREEFVYHRGQFSTGRAQVHKHTSAHVHKYTSHVHTCTRAQVHKCTSTQVHTCKSLDIPVLWAKLAELLQRDSLAPRDCRLQTHTSPRHNATVETVRIATNDGSAYATTTTCMHDKKNAPPPPMPPLLVGNSFILKARVRPEANVLLAIGAEIVPTEVHATRTSVTVRCGVLETHPRHDVHTLPQAGRHCAAAQSLAQRSTTHSAHTQIKDTSITISVSFKSMS
jgi:hypothetical protein